MKVIQGQNTRIPESRIANKAEVAEFFGITLPGLDGWIRKGCPYISKGSKGIGWQFDLLAVAEWKFMPDGTEFDPDELSPRDRKDWYDSEKKKRELQVRDAELYVAHEYDRTFSKILKSVAMGLETLPDVVERSAGISTEQMSAIIPAIDNLRESIYKQIQGIE